MTICLPNEDVVSAAVGARRTRRHTNTYKNKRTNTRRTRRFLKQKKRSYKHIDVVRHRRHTPKKEETEPAPLKAYKAAPTKAKNQLQITDFVYSAARMRRLKSKYFLALSCFSIPQK